MNLKTLIFFSTLVGLLSGIYFADWQHAVEVAQHLMQRVTYAEDNALPNFYFYSAHSLTNYIAILLLKFFNSEVIASIILGALISTLTAITIALLAYKITENSFISALILAFIFSTKFIGDGVNYPIHLLGTPHTHGRLGLILGLFSIVLISYKKYKTGFLLAALLIGFHPVWGVWVNFLIFLIFLISFKKYRHLMTKEIALMYVSGLIFIIIFHITEQYYFRRYLQVDSIDAEAMSTLFNNYIELWDTHRAKISNLEVVLPAVFFSLITLIYSIIIYKKEDKSTQFLILFLLLSSILSWPLFFIPSWFEARYFSQLFVLAMPSRLINLGVFPATTLIISALFFKAISNRMYCATLIIFSIISIYIYKIDYEIGYLNNNFIVISSFGLGLLSIYKRYFKNQLFNLENKYLIYALNCIFFISIFTLLPYAVNKSPAGLFQRAENESLYGKRYKYNNVVLSGELEGPLTLMYGMAQLQPITNYYLNGPQFLYMSRKFFADLYGVDIAGAAIGPPFHQGIYKSHYWDLWEKRGCSDWKLLADKYHFSLVQVLPEMNLNLRKISENSRFKIYVVDCATNYSPDIFTREVGEFSLAPGWYDCPSCSNLKFLRNPPKLPAVKIGDTLFFGKSGAGKQYLIGVDNAKNNGSGWAYPEDWGVWAEGSHAQIYLPFIGQQPNTIIFNFRAFITDSTQRQRINIYINGLLERSLVLKSGIHNIVSIAVPSDLNRNYFFIEFGLPDAVSPKDLGVGSDERKISIGLVSVDLKQ